VVPDFSSQTAVRLQKRCALRFVCCEVLEGVTYYVVLRQASEGCEIGGNSSTFNNKKLFMERYYMKIKNIKGERFEDIVSYEIPEEFRRRLIKLLLKELQ
jgi:hypothetical protein